MFRYVQDAFGLRMEDHRGDLLQYVDEALALIYDCEHGVLHKHGSADTLRKRYAELVQRAAGTHLCDHIVLVEFPVEKLTSELLADIHKAMDISGYVTVLHRKYFGQVQAPALATP